MLQPALAAGDHLGCWSDGLTEPEAMLSKIAYINLYNDFQIRAIRVPQTTEQHRLPTIRFLLTLAYF